MIVQPQSLQDKGQINCIPTPQENAEAWQRQKDITGVLSGVLTNARHKCCSFDPTLNEIDCTIQTASLEFSFTPKKWLTLDDLEILKKAGRINIEEMRLIQLMHPEYQINNKMLDRRCWPMQKSIMRLQGNNTDQKNIIKQDCYY